MDTLKSAESMLFSWQYLEFKIGYPHHGRINQTKWRDALRKSLISDILLSTD